MKTSLEFLKHYTEDIHIYPDDTSAQDIAQFKNAIIQAMEAYAKQQVIATIQSSKLYTDSYKQGFDAATEALIRANKKVQEHNFFSNPKP